EQQLALPQPDRQRERLQRDERLPQGRPPIDAVPRRKEPSERRRLDRLDLATQRSERGSAQTPGPAGGAPPPRRPRPTQLAANEQLLALEPDEQVGEVAPETGLRVGGRERPAALGEPQDELAQGVGTAFEERLGQPTGRHHAEAVAIAARVLRRDQALLS